MFTREELDRIIETARSEMPEHYAAVLTLARTGARIGEVLSFQVDDIDHERGTLLIRRTLARSGDRNQTLSAKPKGGRNRRVELSDQLKAALAEQESLVRAEAALRGTESPLWLFPEREGRRRRNAAGWRRDVWRILLRRAGVRYRKPHYVRHSVASLLLETGAGLVYVSELLGHHSPSLTAKTYAHALPNANRGALNRLDTAPKRTPRAPSSGDRVPTV